MPKIAALMQLPDGRIGVALDCPRTDEGSVTIWTEAERTREIRLAVLAEREACAALADAHSAHMATTAQKHPDGSDNRDRCHARAREAEAIAAAIRDQMN